MKIFKRFRNLFALNPSTIVLMYHRIIDADIDPWQLSVSPDHFEQQLQVLQKSRRVIPLPELVSQINAGTAIKPGIVITFDDGYVDNFLIAKQLLEKYRLPATFFISTKLLGTNKGFWWDDLADIILKSPVLPRIITLSVKNGFFSFDLKSEQVLDEEIYQRHIGWNAYKTPVTRRSLLFMKLWNLLSIMDYEEQQVTLDELKELTQSRQKTNSVMSTEQLLSLADNKLFTIGGHTVTHPMLSMLPRELQEKEISQNKYALTNLLKQKIDLFAYPSGKYNEETVDVLKESAFKAALTTIHKPIHAKEDPFHLGRFQVNNWAKEEFEVNLSRWC